MSLEFFDIVLLILALRLFFLLNRDLSASVVAHCDYLIEDLDKKFGQEDGHWVVRYSNVSRTSDSIRANISLCAKLSSEGWWVYRQLRQKPSYFPWLCNSSQDDVAKIVKSLERKDSVDIKLFTKAKYNFLQFRYRNELYFSIYYSNGAIMPFNRDRWSIADTLSNATYNKLPKHIRRSLSSLEPFYSNEARRCGGGMISVERLKTRFFDTVDPLYESINASDIMQVIENLRHPYEQILGEIYLEADEVE
jgi:hypothetical protein